MNRYFCSEALFHRPANRLSRRTAVSGAAASAFPGRFISKWRWGRGC